MRQVIELRKNVMGREPEPEVIRARQRPINLALTKSSSPLKCALRSYWTFILYSTISCESF